MNFRKIEKTGDITVFQLRAARRALNITVREMSLETGLAVGVIVRGESGDLHSFPQKISLVSASRMKVFLESHGIVFLLNNTVSLLLNKNELIFKNSAKKH